MEIDRKVADYMQKRNAYIKRATGIVVTQLLIVAVFFCAYLFLQTSSDIAAVLGRARLIVRVLVGCAMLAAGVYGIIITVKNKDLFEDLPDEIGLRQSHEVIECAYDIAREALIYKITISVVLLFAGVLAAFIIIAVLGFYDKGLMYSKTIFTVAAAMALYVFVPSYDRIQVYKQMTGVTKQVTGVAGRNNYKSFCSIMILLFVLITLSFIVFLNWRYFGNNRTIAWIVFPLSGVLFLAGYAIADYLSKKA